MLVDTGSNPTQFYGGYSDNLGCDSSDIYWYSSSKPTDGKNKWHYIDGEKVIWE